MKILIVNGHLGVGGVEKSLVDLLKSFDYSKYQVDLLLFEGYGEFFEQVPKEVRIILCDLSPTYGSFVHVMLNAVKKRDFKTIILKVIMTCHSRINIKFLKLLKVLKIVDRQYDCAIAYRIGICTNFVGYVVNAKNKCMWWHHGEFDYEKREVERWRQALNKLDRMVCVSDFTRNLITPQFPEKASRMKVISNMVRRKEIISKASCYHPYVGENRTVLVSVGRFSPEKNMINAVHAMKRLKELGYKKLVWYLVGDGKERGHIAETIKLFGLQSDVICVGSQENPYPYMKDADIYVHLSYIESQGITILEAMVLEKICVVTRSEGTSEYVVDGKNAFVAQQSIESIVEKIRLILDKKCVNDWAVNQRITVDRFNPEYIMGQIYELIDNK